MRNDRDLREGSVPRDRAHRSLTALLVSALLALPSGAAGAVPAELRDELETAEAELAELDATASLAVEEVNAAGVRLEQAQAALAGVADRIDALEERIDTGQREVNRFVSALYKRGRATSIETAFDSEGPGEAGVRLARLQRVTGRQQLQVAQLAAARDELERSQQELATARDRAAAEQDRLEAEQAELQRLLDEQRDEVVALTARIEEIERREREEREAAERRRREDAAREREAAAQETATDEEPAPAPEPARPVPATNGSARTAVDTAMDQIGKPYRWGGGGPSSYDCSGLTAYAWRAAGKTLPHSSRAQYAATSRIARSQLQPGDLVFFGSPIHHVAMYIGDGRVVEAPYSGKNVRVNSRSMSRSDLAGYGRP